MVSHVIFSPVVVCSVPWLMKLLLGKVGTGWEEFCPVLQDCSVAEAAGTVARHRTGDMHEEEYSFHLLFPLVDWWCQVQWQSQELALRLSGVQINWENTLLFFLKGWCFYLRGAEVGRRKRDRESFHMLVHSLNNCNHWNPELSLSLHVDGRHLYMCCLLDVQSQETGFGSSELQPRLSEMGHGCPSWYH